MKLYSYISHLNHVRRLEAIDIVKLNLKKSKSSNSILSSDSYLSFVNMKILLMEEVMRSINI